MKNIGEKMRRLAQAVRAAANALRPRLRAFWDRFGYVTSMVALLALIGVAATIYRGRTAAPTVPAPTATPEPALASSLNLEMCIRDRDTRVRDFGEFLQINRPGGGERFLLLSASATYHDVRAAFERAGERDSRLAAVFITPNGRMDEPLLGMLTPWDVLGRR